MSYTTVKDIYDEDFRDLKKIVSGFTIFGAICIATLWVCINILVRLLKFFISLIMCTFIIPICIIMVIIVKDFDFFEYCSFKQLKIFMLSAQEKWT